MGKIVFFDFEIDNKGKILDIGAIRYDGEELHKSSVSEFIKIIEGCDFLCGHNIVEHDYKYLRPLIQRDYTLIDTLYLSPLLFPRKPYHRLLKDDKLLNDELNNPLNDAKKARSLYEDEVDKFNKLSKDAKNIYYELTKADQHFIGFFKSVHYTPERKPLFFKNAIEDRVKDYLDGNICKNANITLDLKTNPVACAYATSIIKANDKNSITPAWVTRNYPETERIIWRWRNTPCKDPSCKYCREMLDSHTALKHFFGYDKFRSFGGEPLQQQAVEAAIKNESILAIFPTGGGKSLTFQLPALIAGESVKGLTVVISPLQSLMKDQVENLERKGISGAVYINGLLSPVERRDALERVFNGEASLLYIAPEQLRSRTIERALTSRNIVRFVIDEAHCFSAWGQDFRIEYMFIADFIKAIMSAKGTSTPIPVSCFTATAKPKVISDIADYFRNELNISLHKFTTEETRKNLHYTVLYRENDEHKYQTLRSLLDGSDCPAIIYVTRTKTTERLAERLSKDGLSAKAFHGQMDATHKISTQNEFMDGTTRIIVATSAFGMGVDKSDVGIVVHYEISDSLENYIQEAGRAGRDFSKQAACYVLYNDDDLNKHFILLNQTKLTFSEINQVWKAIKQLTAKHSKTQISALEIARKAGWEEIRDVETKVKSALGALESAGYIKRGMNSPRVFATSISAQNMDEAAAQIEQCTDLDPEDKIDARRIIRSLISERSRSKAGTSEAESRIDYLSDILGIELKKVVRIIEKLRSAGILAKDEDMSAYLRTTQARKLTLYARLEAHILSNISENTSRQSLKELNESAIKNGIASSSVKDIKTILFFWIIRGYIEKASLHDDYININVRIPIQDLKEKIESKNAAAAFILERFKREQHENGNETKVQFCLASIAEEYKESSLTCDKHNPLQVIEGALLFLAKTGIINLEGGFMVLYNKLEIQRTNDNNRTLYKKEDYKNLDEFYKQRIKQIHIVGKYANMMISDEKSAMRYVQDYFALDFNNFIKKYFDKEEQDRIGRNVSTKKYNEIFGTLTQTQSKVIGDKESKYIVVPAGPGSGKTYVLVRKLASLLLMEDIKSEQLLMLTFSRAAAMEFKTRLKDLVGNAAEFVEIKTFHSYCFDLLGRVGTLDMSNQIVQKAVEEIKGNRVERSLITKSILVIDEAQDMSADEFALVESLIQNNEDMRVIAVGDDDQNIFSFRGSDSRNMKNLIDKYNATVYEMTENFRSGKDIIDLANSFVKSIGNRLKTNRITSTLDIKGHTRLTLHLKDGYYEQAIINEIASSPLTGSTAILTATNDDALIICALLNHNGIKAKLVQSKEDFALSNLAEFKFFLNLIASHKQSYLDNETWEKDVQVLKKAYAQSRNIDIVQRCIESFHEEFPKRKFISDFSDFLLEASLDQFSKDSANKITVSTIHKSKGREYDNVFISLKGHNNSKDDERRTIYVGITRAKSNLSVHYENPETFKNLPFQLDRNTYEAPAEVLLQLSHKDIVLSFFEGREAVTSKLFAGAELFVNGDYLTCVTESGARRNIVKFSSAMRDKIAKLQAKGYTPARAYVRHQVYWKNEDGKEILILLPDLYLSRG